MKRKRLLLLAGFITMGTVPVFADDLTLERAEAIAISNDAGYSSMIQHANALADRAASAGQLPDPMLSVGWLNLPVEDFNLSQEPMNQVRVAVKQSFPSGNSLVFKKDSSLADANATRAQAAARRLSVLMKTRRAWLETQYAEDAQTILKQNETLFKELGDITQSLYSNGKKALNDVVRSELEIQRLKDREVQIDEEVDKQRALLARWVGDAESRGTISRTLPDWQFSVAHKDAFTARLIAHPAVLAMDRRVDEMRAQVGLVRQQYKPSWSLELGYSFRNARRGNGTEVSNLASVGASINLPFFTENRQDKNLSAANAQLNATLDARLNLIDDLSARLDVALVRLAKLNDRIRLHRTLIVPQTKEQADAALLAYQTNRTDFAEVMRARIAELDSTLALRRLETDRLEAIASIWYLLPPAGDLTRATSLSGDSHDQ